MSNDLSIERVALAFQGQGYSASDLKLLVDEAAKLAMQQDQDIAETHLQTTARHKVRPSINPEQEMQYQNFMSGAASA